MSGSGAACLPVPPPHQPRPQPRPLPDFGPDPAASAPVPFPAGFSEAVYGFSSRYDDEGDVVGTDARGSRVARYFDVGALAIGGKRKRSHAGRAAASHGQPTALTASELRQRHARRCAAGGASRTGHGPEIPEIRPERSYTTTSLLRITVAAACGVAAKSAASGDSR